MPNTCKSSEIKELALEVSGGRVSNAWVTYPLDWDNSERVLIPNNHFARMGEVERWFRYTTGWARGALASW